MNYKELLLAITDPNKEVVIFYSLGFELNSVSSGLLKFEDEKLFIQPLYEFVGNDFTFSAANVKFAIQPEMLLTHFETLVKFSDPVLATSKTWADLALTSISAEVLIKGYGQENLRKAAWDIFERGLKKNRAPYSDYATITTNLFLRRIQIKDLI